MILAKLFGVGCILFGFFMVVYFPDTEHLQTPAMGWTGVLIGIFSILLGIYLLKV